MRGVRRTASAALFVALALVLAACPARMTDAEKYGRDGNDLFQTGDYEAAEIAFHKVVELRPGEAGPLMNRGNARMMLGRNDEALTDYDAALAADPEFGKAYANRGILRDRMGDEVGAMSDYRQALELEPELAEGPSIWQRIIRNPPTETILQRLQYLNAKHATGNPGSP